MDKKWRNLIYIAISAICIIAIIVAVYSQFFAKKVVTVKQVNNVQEDDTDEDETTDNPKDVLAEFNNLFTNKFDSQDNSVGGVKKIEGLEDKNIVYTALTINEEKDNEYSIDAKLPVINIDSSVVTKFNETTQTLFADKTSSILKGTDKFTVYSVEYVAYLNNNILSVAIKSTLKEGSNPQRVIVQTYNYDIVNDIAITLNDVLIEKDIAVKKVNKKIEEQITEASKNAETITAATGQILYKRDLSNAMYTVDNARNFLYGEDGEVFIVYAYGNNNETSEMDVIKIQ